MVVGRWPVGLGRRGLRLWQLRREPRLEELGEEWIVRAEQTHIRDVSAGVFVQELLTEALGQADSSLGVATHAREGDVACE